MKRTLLLAALAATATTSAFAQSNVTIYGRMNITVERTKFSDSDSTTEMRNNSSRIGFLGSEDLGGGMKALFALEYGTDPTVGGGGLTNRHSWVGLQSGWGTLRGGRMTSEAYYATADYISMHNHDTGTSSDALYDYVSDNNNKIAYRTPTFGGFYAEWQHSLGEGVGPHTNDVSAYYKNGPIDLGAGYAKINDANWLATIRALYSVGNFTFGGYYERDGGDFEDGSDAKRNNIRLAAMYALGANEFHVNVGKAGDRGGEDDTGALQWTLGYNYNLSKRTKVYGYYTKVNNEDEASYFSGREGVDFSSLAVGIRHNF